VSLLSPFPENPGQIEHHVMRAVTVAEVEPLRVAHKSEEEIDILSVVRRLWDRKLLIWCLTALLALPATAVIFNLTPRYRAEAQVMVDDRKLQVVSLPEVLTGPSVVEETVLSEVQVIASRDLAKTVVEKLDLKSDPEFNPALRTPGLIDAYREKLVDWARRLFGRTAPPAADDAPAAAEARLINAFLQRLTVDPLGRSRVIRIDFDSESPQTAALVVNTVAELYMENQVQAKSDATKKATLWLEDHVAELRQRAEASRIAKEQFRRETGLLQSGAGSTLGTDEAAEVSKQLTAARARQSEAEARLANAKKAIASGNNANLSEVVQAPQIQALRENAAAVRQKIAEFDTTYGPKYPPLERTKAQLVELDQAIADESKRIIRSLSTDLAREKATVDQLTQSLDKVKAALGDSNEAAAKMATLDHELVTNDTLYMLFLDRMKQTELQQGVQQPDSRVISQADPPDQPYFPRRSMLLALALLTAGLISSFVALVLDRRSNTLMGLDQVQPVLGSGSIGFVPMVKRFREKNIPQLFAEDSNLPRFSDAIRNLHARLLVTPAQPARTVMFASALPGEGKSVSAMALALLTAHVGRRAIVVDCDTRRPSVHSTLGLSRSEGLTEYLEGAPLESVIRTVGSPALSVITAGHPVSYPAMLFASPRMKQLLVELENSYDLVVVDCCPVLTAADAVVLAPMVDKTVFLVQWGTTPQKAAERALDLLREAGADVAGTMLSMANPEKMMSHDLGTGFYRKARRYYQAT
jgi:polysaccharide biosynthesis transport protein